MSDDRSQNKLFIGGLSLQTDKESLQEYFEQYGEIIDAVVMKDPHTKRSRGFGFVTYAENKSVEDCIGEAEHSVDGRVVEAKRAIPREDAPNQPVSPQVKKVFLGGLSLETSEDDVKEIFEAMGVVKEVTIMREKDSERSRGFGFAIFESTDVVDTLCAKRYIKIKDRDVEVKKAISQEEMRREEPMSRGRSGGQSGGYSGGRDHSSSYGGSRDSYSSSYGRGAYQGGVSGYDYRYGMGGDYSRADPYYGYSGGYDRAAYAYAANSYGRGGYDMAAYNSMYGAAAAAAAAAAGMTGGSGYNQTSSSYGPSRGSGYSSVSSSGTDYGKERGGSSRPSSYHPYRRAQ